MADEHPNRLINEKSPYLRQHATNPVDWYPWGEEAFEKARTLSRPIFLSIGYATCHWCHVMERESFEDPAIAALMNDAFINVKVDREELPQVDSLYMDFAQIMLGQGAGWPLTLILTPDLKPIFAATYLPPEGSEEEMGVKELVTRIGELWSSDEREGVVEQADEIVQMLSLSSTPMGESERLLPTRALVDSVAHLFYRLADPVYGGMEGAPKFPTGYHYDFLLAYAHRYDESRALFYVRKSLDRMERGGIYDQLGGGFSRYSVDEMWLIPHFEKMLVDNALMATAYCSAWRATRLPLFREVASEVLDYLLRDRVDRQGGFYSAEDADSEGEEGRFYTWDAEEILEQLGPEDGALICDYYGVTVEGNFNGRNVLHLGRRLDSFAAERHLDPVELRPRIDKLRQTLLKIREKRPRPGRDDKVVTAWNGLAIRAFAEAGWAFQELRYTQAAVQAARFLQRYLWVEGRLRRRWCEGEAAHSATLSDYACLISGLLSLFRVGGRSEWLEWAVELAEILYNQFKQEDGPFFESDGEDPNLLLRRIEMYDGAEPSGNAIHCENLLRLHQLTGAEDYLLQAEDILRVMEPWIVEQPIGAVYQCVALIRYLDAKRATAVIALDEQESLRKEIEEWLAPKYLPHLEIIWRRPDDQKLFKLIPSVKGQSPIDGKTTLYLCRSGVCSSPTSDLSQIYQLLSY